MKSANVLRVLYSRVSRPLLQRIGVVFGRIVNCFPALSQSHLLEQLSPIGVLDYGKSKIVMGVRSSWAHYRLGSCNKEPETVAWLEKTISQGDVFCDIGANVGAYTLVAASIMRSSGTVYAVEPSFSTFSQLSENITLNQITTPGVMVVPIYAGLGDSTRIEMLGISDVHAGSARHAWAGQPHCQEGEVAVNATLPVMCYSLDDLVETFGLQMPTVMKIDVDGPEIAVVKGAIGCLRNEGFRSLLIELDNSQLAILQPILESAGLELTAKHNHGGRWSNCIFQKNGSRSGSAGNVKVG